MKKKISNFSKVFAVIFLFLAILSAQSAIAEPGVGCWKHCKMGFTNCYNICGGGSGCWKGCDSTSLNFFNCFNYCGGGEACWERCPDDGYTCHAYCDKD